MEKIQANDSALFPESKIDMLKMDDGDDFELDKKVDLDSNDEEEDDEGEDGNNLSNESTGRWKKEEHALFLEALEKYGKEWKKVASMVKTRTVVQTRTHAQKYFQKVMKMRSSGFDDIDIKPSTALKPRSGANSNSSSSKKNKRATIKSTAFDDYLVSKGSILSSPEPVAYSEDDGDLYLNTTPTFVTSLKNLSSIPNSKKSEPLPQPSPAACGKRKHAELNAARILAATSHDTFEGIEVLSSMKESKQYNSNNPKGLSLSIPNFVYDSDDRTTPGTPWDYGVKALEEKVQAQRASTDSTLEPVAIQTPKEQRSFLSQIRNILKNNELQDLVNILQAADYSAQTYVDVNTSSATPFLANASVSNLMAIYTPNKNTEKVLKEENEVPITGNLVKSRRNSLVARSLNRIDSSVDRCI